jgi:hypothetical protein
VGDPDPPTTDPVLEDATGDPGDPGSNDGALAPATPTSAAASDTRTSSASKVLGTQVRRNQLAVTGGNSRLLVTLGTALVMVGMGVVLLSQRPRRRGAVEPVLVTVDGRHVTDDRVATGLLLAASLALLVSRRSTRRARR